LLLTTSSIPRSVSDSMSDNLPACRALSNNHSEWRRMATSWQLVGRRTECRRLQCVPVPHPRRYESFCRPREATRCSCSGLSVSMPSHGSQSGSVQLTDQLDSLCNLTADCPNWRARSTTGTTERNRVLFAGYEKAQVLPGREPRFFLKMDRSAIRR
jgi:hypothetical protein